MRTYILTFFAVLIVSGCAAPINRKNATDYYAWGLEAEMKGDYALAERNYDRALINARLGNSPDAGISAALYSLGRMKGYLCKYDEAEKLLVDSLALEEKVTGPESAITTKRLFELARLYSDRGLYQQSLPYYERGIPVVRKMDMEVSDPIALADALADYSTAAEKSGQQSKSQLLRKEADALRKANNGKAAKYTPIRYKKSCPN
jgi:tetratricopeptide (TPR) repeat protein